MANDFSARSDCKALWNFETGALTTDSKGTNTLTATGVPTADGTNYKQGSYSVSLAAGQYYTITDANLATGFPLKSGDSTKTITVACWVRPTTVDTNQRRIWSKWKTSGSLKSLMLYHTSSSLYLQYSTNGSVATSVSFSKAMTANQWYHVTVVVDGVAATYWARIFDATAGTYTYASGTLSTGVNVSTAAWMIGYDEDLTANQQFLGNIDEMVVFNTCLNSYEPNAIKGGVFPASVNAWFVDPTNGLDSNDGTSFTTPFKTLYRTYRPGDLCYVAKNVETAQPNTGSATNGSKSITGISGWTPAANTIIRCQGDNEVYCIASFAGSTITLTRPYRGTTGSKTINLLTTPALAANTDLQMAGAGTPASNVEIRMGINTSDRSQDGWTIWDQHGYYGFQFPTFYKTSRLGLSGYNGGSSRYFFYTAPAYMNITDIYACYYGSIHPFGSNAIAASDITNWVVESLGRVPSWHCKITGLEIGGSYYDPFGGWGSKIYNLKTSPTSGYAMYVGAAQSDVELVNANLDELNLCTSGAVYVSSSNATGRVLLKNPTISANAMGTLVTTGGNNPPLEVSFDNPNNTGSFYHYFCYYGITGYLTRDTSVYNNTSPSAQFYQVSTILNPLISRHQIPLLAAGGTKTIGVYLRKNSTYGSQYLPKMRLGVWEGSPAVYNVYEVAMPDTNNSFVQVTQQVTPCQDQIAVLEIIHQCPNAGGQSWYDDISVN